MIMQYFFIIFEYYFILNLFLLNNFPHNTLFIYISLHLIKYLIIIFLNIIQYIIQFI